MAIHPVDATLEAAKIDPDQRAERLKGVKLDGAGHFPPTEIPERVNALIEEFVTGLS